MVSTGRVSEPVALRGGGGRSVSDAAGFAVLGACAAWSLVTAAVNGGRPEGMLLAVLAVTAGYAAGRILGAIQPAAALFAAALTGFTVTLAAPRLTTGPEINSPLGSEGATAAVLVLSSGAACCAAWSVSRPGLRLLLRAGAVGIAVTAGLLGSAGAGVFTLGVLLCSFSAGRVGHRRGLGFAVLLGIAALAAGVTWAVAGRAVPDGLAACLEGPLTRQRVELWQDALRMASDHTVLGVGPGRFGELSPTAAQTLLSDGKPHSAPFQQAAEQGLLGLVLLAAVFCWLLWTLWRAPRPTPVVLTAGAALTALAVIACVGNALSFTVVSVGAGLLAGLTTARPLAEEPPAPEPVTGARV
jgi:O-antigen ligase